MEGVDWPAAARGVVEQGWIRLRSALDLHVCEQLVAAAPDAWVTEEPQIGDVRLRGQRTGGVFDDCAPVIRQLGEHVRTALNHALAGGIAPAPAFNTVTWGRTQDGSGYISRHRDPPTASGVIIVATLRGRALFRIWGRAGAEEWETADGDVVVMRGTDWPHPGAHCPEHEARSLDLERVTLTFRHNIRGPAADFFN